MRGLKARSGSGLHSRRRRTRTCLCGWRHGRSQRETRVVRSCVCAGGRAEARGAPGPGRACRPAFRLRGWGCTAAKGGRAVGGSRDRGEAARGCSFCKQASTRRSKAATIALGASLARFSSALAASDSESVRAGRKLTSPGLVVNVLVSVARCFVDAVEGAVCTTAGSTCFQSEGACRRWLVRSLAAQTMFALSWGQQSSSHHCS